VGDGFGRHGTGADKTRRHLKIGQVRNPVDARRDVAAAQGGRQRLGEAADADDPVQPVQRRQTGGGLGLQIGEKIILDDGEVMRGGQIQQAVRRLGRDAGAGRVLKSRVGQIEPGRRLFQYGFEPFDVRAASGRES
jgi:hypothetical protein